MLSVASRPPSSLHWSHMLFSELLFALLLVCLVAGMAGVAFTVPSIPRLPGGKLLRMDCKWPSSAALRELAEPDALPARRAQLAAVVEKEVERRVREVSQYIDPATTAPFALAAVPDAAYGVCRSAFAEAHRRHVMIVAYSLTLPYLLMLYQLHLQFARSVDMEHLQACLMEVDRQLDALDASLENKLQRAVTMLGNAYQDGKQVTARIRASVRGIQATGRLDDGGDPVRATVDEPLLSISLRQG